MPPAAGTAAHGAATDAAYPLIVRVLVVNAGSSSLKLALVDGGRAVAALDLDAEAADLDRHLDQLGPADAVGHRVVHGGDRFTDPVVIDDGVLAALDELVTLDPLHQPIALGLVRRLRAARPDVPHVACFDTAFHATLPAAASTYAVPVQWRAWGVRRYGFHGLSHAWAATRAAALSGRPIEELATVTCHLGSGASLAAVDGGRSVDTTMGFTPLDGIVMASRPGSLDPGVVPWLVARRGLDAAEVERQLYERSGLTGLAGTGDMKALLQRDDDDARLALDVYLHRLRGAVAAMVAALGRLDVLVFTGGVGEHAPAIRQRAAAGLGFLGVAVDQAANHATTADGDITAPGAAARTLVVTAREDLQIAHLVESVLTRFSRD
jgi:acetate kinase